MSDLGRLQRWTQAVLTDPGGVAAGARSDEARAALDTAAPDVVRASPSLSPEECLEVYASMYLDRLVEALEEDFPALKALLGSERFFSCLRAYVARHPSTHWSLTMLGAKLPGFLRVEAPGLEQRAFAAELAALERGIQEVFDAPRAPALSAGAVERLAPEAWGRARLVAAPALRLFAFEHPVDAWYSAFREGKPGPAPAPDRTWVVLYRRDDRVWRAPIVREQHALLAALVEGEPLGGALERAAALPGADQELLAGSLGAWFQRWTADGLFTALELG